MLIKNIYGLLTSSARGFAGMPLMLKVQVESNPFHSREEVRHNGLVVHLGVALYEREGPHRLPLLPVQRGQGQQYRWRTETALWSGVSASSFRQLERVAHRSVRVSWSDRHSRH